LTTAQNGIGTLEEDGTENIKKYTPNMWLCDQRKEPTELELNYVQGVSIDEPRSVQNINWTFCKSGLSIACRLGEAETENSTLQLMARISNNYKMCGFADVQFVMYMLRLIPIKDT